MEQQDSGIDFKKYITILKHTTIFIQLLPFIYSSIYVIVLLVYPFVTDEFAGTLDSLFYISPTFMAGLLILSKILHLCLWHRIACLIPIVSQTPVFIDNYILSMTQVEAIASNAFVIIMVSLLLVAAYKVFFANGRR